MMTIPIKSCAISAITDRGKNVIEVRCLVYGVTVPLDRCYGTYALDHDHDG